MQALAQRALTHDRIQPHQRPVYSVPGTHHLHVLICATSIASAPLAGIGFTGLHGWPLSLQPTSAQTPEPRQHEMSRDTDTQASQMTSAGVEASRRHAAAPAQARQIIGIMKEPQHGLWRISGHHFSGLLSLTLRQETLGVQAPVQGPGQLQVEWLSRSMGCGFI